MLILLNFLRQINFLAAERKVAIFREWRMQNGGSNALVRNLIRVLRRERVAVDVWEFLDPDRSIRNSLDNTRAGLS